VRCALLALTTGTVLAVGAPAGWFLAGGSEPASFGGAAAQDLAAPPPAPAALLVPESVGTSSARLSDVVTPRDPPVEVGVGGKRARLDAVGLDDERLVVIPEDVRRAGWYEPGAEPGADAGSAVLVGHVDDRTQGLGAFAVLRELSAGDEVTVRTASGEQLVYDVLSLEQFDKQEVPMDRLFTRSGPHRLVLISCAGAFDPSTGSYSDNVVVTAVPRQ